MQKLVKLIEKSDGEYLPLRLSTFFKSKYHFSSSMDYSLLEWLLNRRLDSLTDDVVIKNPIRVQAFLILRTLVSCAAYSKWFPEDEFSDLFEFGITGANSKERISDLAIEVANDLQLLRTKVASDLLKELTIEMNEIAKSLSPLEESEKVIPFWRFENDPFWQFEETWENRCKKSPNPLKDVFEDPFEQLIGSGSDPIGEMVAEVVESTPLEPTPVQPLVSTLVEPPKRPVRPRVQPKVFSRSQFQKEQEQSQGMDFMTRMLEEVKRESSIEGGI